MTASSSERDSTSSADPGVRLARVFVELADTLTGDYDLQDFLYRLLHRCTELFNAPAAGIMLKNARGGVELVASSSEASENVEMFQLQADIGPCLECVTTALPVRSPDLAADVRRWPGWCEVALGSGYRSVYATPLRLRDQTIGAMNLFGTEPDALGDADLSAIQGLADIATIGILQQRAVRRSEQLSEQLQTALDSRVLIEQAKGIVSGRTDLDVSVDRAFLLLRDHARRTNTKLGAVCQAVVDGSLDAARLVPGPRPGPGPDPGRRA